MKKMTNRKILALTGFTLLMFAFMLLMSAADAGVLKPGWLIQKEQGEDDEEKEVTSGEGSDRMSISSVSDAIPTKLPRMYFGDNRLLWKAGLLGDFQTTFLPLSPDLGNVAVDAGEGKIYFMPYWNYWIKRMDLDGRNVENVLSEKRLEELSIGRLGKCPGDCYVDTVDKKVYWLAWEENPDTGRKTLSTISRLNLDGTGPIEEVIRVENRNIFYLTIDEISRKLYWLEDEETDDGLYGFITTIRSATLDGGDIRSHITGIQTYMDGFSIDNVEKHVYWIASIDDESGSHYTLRRGNLDNPGGAVDVGADGGEIVIDLGTGYTASILVDEVNRILYWLGEKYFFDINKYVYTVQRANLDDEFPAVEIVVRTQSDWLNYVTLNRNIGNLYWTESDQLITGEWLGTLWSVNLDGTEEPKDLTNIDFPGGIAVDKANEKVYWTAPDLGVIRRANLDGSDMVDLLTDLNQPEDIVVDPVGDKFYWTQGPGPDEEDYHISYGSVRRANLDGTDWEVFDSWAKTPAPRGLSLDPVDRVIYFAIPETYWDNGRIEAINVDNKDYRWVAKNLNKPLGIAVDAVNRQLYWTEPEDGFIKRSNLDGTRITIIISGLKNPRGIAVDPINETIYWTSNDEAGGDIGKIQRANLDGTGVELLIKEADPSVKYIDIGVWKVKPALVYPTGDVSGDYKVDAFDAALILQFSIGMIDRFPVDALIGMSPENALPRHYEVSVPNLSAKRGEHITVPIVINEVTGFLAGGIRLKYDAAVLKAVRAYSGLSGAYWKANTELDGEIRMAFASLEKASSSDGSDKPSATQPKPLFAIEFEVLSNSEGEESPLMLDYVELSNSLSIQKTDGIFTLLPRASRLFQNYPNPFNPETWIPYQLSADSDVALSIYDTRGRIVRQLMFQDKSAGLYLQRDKAAHWDGRNSAGELLGSGLYFYVLKAGDFIATRRMLILK